MKWCLLGEPAMNALKLLQQDIIRAAFCELGMLQSVNYVNIGVHLKLRLHFKNSLRGLHSKCMSRRIVEVYTW
jgi:hypothetical protein